MTQTLFPMAIALFLFALNAFAGEAQLLSARRLQSEHLKAVTETCQRLTRARSTAHIPNHGVYDDFRVVLDVHADDAAGWAQAIAAAKKAGVQAIYADAGAKIPADTQGVLVMRKPAEAANLRPICNLTDATECCRSHVEAASKNPDIWRALLADFRAFPDAYFSAGSEVDPEGIAAWGREVEQKPCVAVGLCGARQALRVNDALFDPYELSFRQLCTHVLARELSEADIGLSLREGHAYVSFDWMCDPTGFVFGAGNNFGIFPMGDTAPSYGGTRIMGFTPVPAHLKLIHDGKVVAEANDNNLKFETREDGAYRLEAWLTIDGEARPWIFSNPVYVRSPTLAAVSALKMPSVEISPNVEIKSDIVYTAGKPEDAAKHKLDIYIPKHVKNPPVLVFIHGGAWRSGDKALYFLLGNRFAKEGILTVAISYRLAPANPHPAQIEDVAAAFAWAVKHVAEYGGDVSRIYVGGHSAGGHLSALLTLDEKYLKAVGLTTKAIRGTISLSGVFNLISIGDSQSAVFGTDEKVRRDASPFFHIGESAAPPFLVTYCQRDYLTLPAQAKEFNGGLRKAGISTELVYIPGENHISEMIGVGLDDDPTVRAMLKFIK